VLTDISFPEFVRYVIDSWHEGAELDRHWIPQFRLCQPCQIHYDFVGHYETLHEDADAVLASLNSGQNPQDVVVRQFPHVDPDNQQFARSSDKMKEFYSSISLDNIDELYRLYATDYALFGYSHRNINN
jgi:dermatan 4-sulfotransferase 1